MVSRADVAFECPEIIGIPAWFTVSNREGKDPIANEVTLKETVPLDLLLYGAEFMAIDSTGEKTDRFGVNFCDSQSEDWVCFTSGNQGRGAPVPVNLLFGDSGSEFLWPAPRIVRETSSFYIRIVPEDGVTIKYVKFIFHGRRLRGDEALDKLCERASRTGYGAIYFEPLELPIDNPDNAALKNGTPSPQRRIPAPIDALPYDFFISGVSSYITTQNRFEPLQGADSIITLSQDVGKNQLFLDGVLSSTIGGMRQNESAPIGAYRAVEHTLKACWRVFQESTLQLQGEHIFSPAAYTEASMFQHLVLHGQRGIAQQLPPFGARRWLFARPNECVDPSIDPANNQVGAHGQLPAWGRYADTRQGQTMGRTIMRRPEHGQGRLMRPHGQRGMPPRRL